jgi:hypothetical protein
VETVKIYEVLKKNQDRHFGAFDEFFQRRQDVEHAYERLRGMTNKPPFDQVYEYVLSFIQPFANRDLTPRVWNSQKASWNVYPKRKRSVP